MIYLETSKKSLWVRKRTQRSLLWVRKVILPSHQTRQGSQVQATKAELLRRKTKGPDQSTRDKDRGEKSNVTLWRRERAVQLS